MQRFFTFTLLLGAAVLSMVIPRTDLWPTSKAQTASSRSAQKPRNVNIDSAKRSVGIQSTISITDSGWTTNTTTSDCATGQGDDTWQLTLTQTRNVTVTVNDCCCSGDYYEVRVDGNLIGTTPNLAPPWGCDSSGPNSSGSFTVTLCPGLHTITVRDAGFDGHSLAEIQNQGMCPAGFTVSGALSAPSAVVTDVTPKIATQSEMTPAIVARAQELQEQMQAVAPFIVTDQDGIQRLRSDDARRAGVGGEALGFAHKLVALNNRIMMAARRGEEPTLERSDFAFIEPLFRVGNPCGSFINPSACPPRVESGQGFASEAEARAYLLSQGYHQTANYAGGSSGRDFTLVVSDATCGVGPFRNQALIHQQGDCWTYWVQSFEPNPEIRSYVLSWPYLGWPGYVFWWHRFYC